MILSIFMGGLGENVQLNLHGLGEGMQIQLESN